MATSGTHESFLLDRFFQAEHQRLPKIPNAFFLLANISN